VTHVKRATDLTDARWRKSTRSGNTGGSCVEVATVGESIAVRDSKDPSGPAFMFDRQVWTGFTTCLRDGGFNER
jgi:hypothetical protein